MNNKGRVTIPTDESFVEGTKIIAENGARTPFAIATELNYLKTRGSSARYTTLISSFAAITNGQESTPKRLNGCFY